jgi:TolB-like protein
MSASPQAVFLSYASQDGEAARHICDALRAVGVEVWFDQSELRGGDAWDASIRRKIKECALFVPVISANTQSREEGYFRREWNLAVARTLDMAEGRTFLLPIIIDGTSDSQAVVPEKFREVQWTHLPAGANTGAFADHVRQLLSPGATRPIGTSVRSSAPPKLSTGTASTRSMFPASRSLVPWIVSGLLILGMGYVVVDKYVLPMRSVPAVEPPATASTAAFNPPEHSIAVLPFVNMSSDKEQEYFSDGLSEELLDLLARLPQLRVIARTSSFSFKGKEVDVATIAKTLNVSSLLEGSVRKSGDTIRIRAELIRTSDSAHVWGETYDRKVTDIFKVQDEIAGAVVAALKVKLLPTQSISNQRATANTEAYRQFLLGNHFYNRGNRDGYQLAESAYEEALALAPEYAPAHAGLARVQFAKVRYAGNPAEQRVIRRRGLAAADKAVELGPDLADGYLARGWLRLYSWDWAGARADFSKALTLDPGDSNVHRGYGVYLQQTRPMDEAIAATRKAIELDPLSAASWNNLGADLIIVGRLSEAREAMNRALAISPDNDLLRLNLARIELLEHRPQQALDLYQRAGAPLGLAGVAMAEHSLGHARASRQVLDKLIAEHAETFTTDIATTYAWRGEKDKAFEWLERAYAQHDFYFIGIKFNPLLAALRDDPRYGAMVKRLGLPD